MQPTVIKIKEEKREREGIYTDPLPDGKLAPRVFSRYKVPLVILSLSFDRY